MEQALSAAKKSAAERAAVERGEAEKKTAILEEEVRFWKIEAMRASREHDTVHQHLKRLVNRRPTATTLSATATSSTATPSRDMGGTRGGVHLVGGEGGVEGVRLGGGEEHVYPRRGGGGLEFGKVGVNVMDDAHSKALLDVRAPLQEATRQVSLSHIHTHTHTYSRTVAHTRTKSV